MAQTADLRALGGQRVWSLMVSLLGDLARDPGDAIDGPLLTRMMQSLDIKPEATRVALHRLRKDDWIASHKRGRISEHSLTAHGRAVSAQASTYIYADPRGAAADWQLVLLAPDAAHDRADLTQRGFTPLTTRIFAGAGSAVPPQGALALQAASAPGWLKAELLPTAQRSAFAALLTTLEAVSEALLTSPPQSSLHRAVLRCLIVHNWRRLVLRYPALPEPLVDKNGPAHRCHLLVWDLLKRYPRPQLSDL
ncbi:MAG: PaaX family transcriptional regulator C-terminal domain-containing protein [Pseudomonadota bacterium]